MWENHGKSTNSHTSRHSYDPVDVAEIPSLHGFTWVFGCLGDRRR